MAWLAGYAYRQKIKIDGTADGAQTDYQMLLTAHSGAGASSGAVVYLKSHCTDFPNDVRFTQVDGETELDYWVEDTGDPAKIWIEFDAIADGGGSPSYTEFYIYYGKSGAATASDGDATFNFFDHFPDDAIDTDKWEGDTGSASVASSICTLTGSGSWLHIRDKTGWAKPRAVMFRGNFVSAGSSKIVGFGDSGWTNRINFYEPAGVTKYAQALKAGSATQITNQAAFVVDAYAIFEAQWSTNKATYICDGSEFADSPIATNVPTANLKAEISIYDDSITIDWIAVRNFAATEPTWGTWGGEEALYNETGRTQTILAVVEKSDTATYSETGKSQVVLASQGLPSQILTLGETGKAQTVIVVQTEADLATFSELQKLQAITTILSESDLATFTELGKEQTILASIIGNAYQRFTEVAGEQVVLVVLTKTEQLIKVETAKEQTIQAVLSSIETQTMDELGKSQTVLVVIEGDAYQRYLDLGMEQVILSIIDKTEQLTKVETGKEQIILALLTRADHAIFTDKQKLQLILAVITADAYYRYIETGTEQVILTILAKGEQLIKGETGKEQIVLAIVSKTEQLTNCEVAREQIVLGIVEESDIQTMFEIGSSQVILVVPTRTDSFTSNETEHLQVILVAQTEIDAFKFSELGKEQIIRIVLTEADALFKYLAALDYVLELHNSDGDLVAILQNAYDISYAQMINSPYALTFALPADDSKSSNLILANEIWIRHSVTGTVVKKFRLAAKKDLRT